MTAEKLLKELADAADLEAKIEHLLAINADLLAEAEEWRTMTMADFQENWNLHAEIMRLKDINADLLEALRPFARNVNAVSLIAALGHITREDLCQARDAIAKA